MTKIILLICSLFISQTVSAQENILDSLKKELAQTENLSERFHLLNRISDITNFQAGNTDSASIVEMVRISEQLNSDSLLAVCYNLIGLYFLGKGDNNNALEYLMKGIPLAEKSNDKRRISSLYFDIASVYFALFNNDQAYKNINFGGKNLPDSSFAYYDYMLVQFQRNMTQYFININQPDSALGYSKDLLETSYRIRSKLFEYAALYLNGSAYSMLGDSAIADSFFRKAVVISDSIKMPEEKLKFYASYIDFLLKENRIQEAQAQASDLMEFANKSNNDNLKMEGAGYLRQIFEKTNNIDSAYFYSKLEMELSDRIFSYKNLEKLQALVFSEKLRVMEEEDRKTKEEEKRKQNIQYLLIAFGIIILIISIMLLSKKVILNTRVIEYFGVMALLIIFEFLNLILHYYLEKLTNHTPLLMLLALVCIAAFLVPFHHKAEKWTTAYMLEKNKMIRLRNAEQNT